MSDSDRIGKGVNLQPQSSNPMGEAGDMYYDSVTKLFYYFDGTLTIPLGSVQVSGGSPQPIGTPASAGVSATASRSDHVHEGTHSVNSVKGDVNVVQGLGVTVNTAAPNITVNFTGAAVVEFNAGTITTQSTTIDWTNGISQRLKVSSNTVIKLTGGILGTLYTLRLSNDFLAHYVVTFGLDNVRWQNNVYPGLSQGINEQTVFYFYFSSDGTYYGFDEQTYSDTQFFGVKQAVISSNAATAGFPSRQVRGFVTYDNQKWYTWGFQNNGELGTGVTSSSQIPHASSFVIGRSFSVIAPGDAHTVGIESTTGNAYAWGLGTSGQLGNQNNNLQSSPISVLGGRSYSKIAASSDMTIALEASTGLAYAWGISSFGQLGNNSITNVSSPISVIGGRSFKWVAAGLSCTAALEGSTGRAYMWGNAGFGALGDNGGITNRSSPTSVVGARSFNRITTRGFMTAAIEGSTGSVYYWGLSTPAPTSPTQLATARSFREVDVSMGLQSGVQYGVAIEGNSGNLYTFTIIPRGNGTTFNVVSGTVQMSGQSFSSISVGNEACIAVEASTGIAYMFGMTTGYGGLFNYPMAGNAWFVNTNVPVCIPPAILGGQSFTQIAARSQQIIGRAGNGQLWGWGAFGNLGNNSVAGVSGPAAVSGGRSFASIAIGGLTPQSSGAGQVLGIEGSTGNAYAWGQGPVGDNTIISRSAPVSVVGGRSYVKAAGITGAGDGFALIEGSTGNAYCWAVTNQGAVGDNTATSRSSPTSVVGGKSYKSIATTQDQVLAVEGSTGTAWSWGSNIGGIGANGNNLQIFSPTAIVGGRSWKIVAGAMSQTNFCAIEGSTGNAYCWGSGANGLNGEGVTTTNRSSPVSVVGGRSFSFIGVADTHFIAIEGSTGNAYAWGLGTSGQIGDGSNVTRSSPTSVSGGRSYTHVNGGNGFSWAVDSQGNNFFWGRTLGAESGNSGTADFTSPISIGRIGRFP